MVEPISLTALIIAIGGLVTSLLKIITDSISKSDCTSSETHLSRNGSIVTKTTHFSGNNGKEEE